MGWTVSQDQEEPKIISKDGSFKLHITGKAKNEEDLHDIMSQVVHLLHERNTGIYFVSATEMNP